MPTRSVQHDTVREHNRHAVLEALRAGGACSRAGLARATGLSVPTVASIAGELMALGLAGEGGLERSAGGRPAQRLRLVPEARNVLALDLAGARLRSARVDLGGTPHPLPDGPELVVGAEASLEAWLDEALAAERAAGREISMLAVAVPSVVDPVGGRVRLVPALGWSDVPLGARLERRCGLPVLIENDVNALALGELHHGAGEGHAHVLYVSIARGIGAALVMGGELYRGAHAAAGEIGYSLVPDCARGSAGAGRSEVARAPDDRGRTGGRRAGGDATPLDLGRPGPLEARLSEIAAAFVDDGRVVLGDDRARAAFAAFAEHVRLTLHNLACALDPELLVVAWAADPDGLLARALARGWQGPLPIDIRPGTLGSDAAVRGVAHLALGRLSERLCGVSPS